MTVTTKERTAVVGIRFHKLGKLYHFKVGQVTNLEPGDYVVVETRRGRQLGQMISFIDTEQAPKQKGMRSIERRANPRDMVMKQVWESKELDALIVCRERAAALKITDAKFVKAEYSFDGSWLTIHYSTEDKKLDVGSLQRSLSKTFNTRIEMRLIGPRDVAKLMGGYGACGAPRCCSTFLTEFSPISIKMAKEQGISLSPQEITGMCGRLRCCLIYEYEQYVEAKKTLPRYGKRIGTPYGEGRVKDVRILRDSVVVQLDDGEMKEVFRHEFEPLEELEALKKKAEAGRPSTKVAAVIAVLNGIKAVNLKRRAVSKTREEAWDLVCELVKDEGLRRHMLAVSVAMAGYAEELGGDPAYWEIVGLLHDFDWEIHPDLDQHPIKGADILRERGWDEATIRTILSHYTAGTSVEREKPIDFALLACDEITGLIIAIALVRPSKSLVDVSLKSVKKKWKDRRFAAGVDRDHVAEVTADFSEACFDGQLDLWQHVERVLYAMRAHADLLELDGRLAAA